MDVTDLKLLSLLQVEGRISNEKLGEAVGLSISAVNERIRKLQKQGVLLGWTAQISPKRLGLDVLAFVHILLGQQADETLFLEGIVRTPEVLECHHITGEWSYLLKIRCKTISHFEVVLGEKIKPIPGVLRTQTLIALSSPLDRTTLPLEDYGD
ncbi:MAG: Lrp/AsnC family transcriptional regulator [Verrucomicrobia bacterium]|nr:Lrp/AsnC family transcriptional regulator [Verrucomicrobiota bacterium]